MLAYLTMIKSFLCILLQISRGKSTGIESYCDSYSYSVKSVSAATRKQLQLKWRMSERRCRARSKAVEAILELTPQSPQGHDQHSNHEVINENMAAVTCSTPNQYPKERQKPLKAKAAKLLRKSNHKESGLNYQTLLNKEKNKWSPS